MKALALYLLAVLFLVLIAFTGWTGWRGVPVAGGHILHETAVQTMTVGEGGDTVPGVAEKLGVSADELAKANDLATTASLPAGTELTVPASSRGWQSLLGTHSAGLGAEFLGVFMSFWLALAIGIIPKGYRVQIFSISFVLALASYAAAQAGAAGNPDLSPQFLFGAIKDGFAWSTAFPMFAWALGIRERKDGSGGPASTSAAAKRPVTPDAVLQPTPSSSPPAASGEDDAAPTPADG
ncbi:MAG: LysM domain-containing protein [Ardenticatenales bacterium]